MSSTSSMICKNFAQNAWKKDLCSNCFKSEVEHNDWMSSTAPIVSPPAPVVSIQQSQQQLITTTTTANNTTEDIKGKTAHNITINNQSANHSSIKALNINNKNFIQTNQIIQTNHCLKNQANNQKSSTDDCQTTTTTILTSKKLANNKNINNNIFNPSPQILMNTKKINSTHVSTNNSQQIINSINKNNSIINSNNCIKDSIKQYNNINNNNNSNDLRKRINSTTSGCEESCNTSSSNAIINCEKSANSLTKDSKNFPQIKEKIVLTQNNFKNNNQNNHLISNSMINTSVQTIIATQVVNSTGSSGSSNTMGSSGAKITTCIPTIATTMPLIGILKTNTTADDLIKYRPKNKCLVFKEGDPLVIGYGIDSDAEYGSDSSDEDDYEGSDDEYDDPLLYTSDDKELRELTRINTKFNSNFANLSIDKCINDSKAKQTIVCSNNQTKPLIESRTNTNCVNSTNGIESSDGRQQPQQPIVANSVKIDETIPKVCEKLVQNGINETFDAINNCNNCVENQSQLTYETTNNSNCDAITPMSTSSDSYSSSSSSGDEKEDLPTIDIKNLRQNSKLIDSSHLKTDSTESDNSSTNSDSGIETKDNYKEDLPQNRPKPQLPVKPNMNTTTKPVFMSKVVVKEENQQKLNQNTNQTEDKSETKCLCEDTEEEDLEESDDKYSPQIVNEHIYQEIQELSVDLNGINGKFVNNNETNNNYLINSGVKHSIESDIRSQEKREIKLAELAQELEQVRHMKRQAPQPPAIKADEQIVTVDEEKTRRHVVSKQSVTIHTSDKQQTSAQNTTTTHHSKHRFSSIRKLLHKKSSSDKTLSDNKSKDNSNEYSFYTTIGSTLDISSITTTTATTPSADRKAWKQSEFDRTNLKIVHPLDMVTGNINSSEVSAEQSAPDLRPEAPPRTPKPLRPSVPARKRNKSSSSLLPPREPPPHPTTPPPQKPSSSLSDSQTTAPVVYMNVKNNITEAYDQLAKSNFSNLLAIKSKIESTFTDTQYKWSDFEVTNACRFGSALLYKDSIVSTTRKSVNLLVLEDCYSTAIVSQFRHHEDLVLALDSQWTKFYLLNELSTESTLLFEQKQINSLILQLYSILEKLENNNCNQLSANTINTIIICASDEDILLIVPIISDNRQTITSDCSNSNESTDSPTHITLQQFLSQLLAKLLPNSLFESVGHVLSQSTVQISHSKTIVQLIAFQIPVHQMTDCDLQINYWFDISRSKFINQFCCLNDTKLFTQLDYIYLKFLCNNNINLIRNSIALMIDSNTNNSK